MKNKFWILYILAFIVISGYTVFGPVIAILIENLGGNENNVGTIIAMAPITTVLFSPILGVLADKWGRKPVIVLGLMGMVAWFGLFAIASSMIYLYAGSFIGGFLSAGAISAATAFISDVTDEEERGGYITKFQAFMMLGAFLPPLIAGYLAEISLSLPFIVMGSIAAIGLILSILLLPETLTKDKKDVSQDETPIKVALSAYTSLGTYLRTNIGPLLIIAF